MKRFILMATLCLSMMTCFAQRKLIYCSCAFTNYGLPVGEIKYSYYELIADKGKKPYVVYCEDRGEEPKKKNFPVTEKDVTTLYKILQDLNVEDLDGYNVNEDMMGGTSYRIHIEFADGKKVTASWFTHHPIEEAVSVYNTILRFLSHQGYTRQISHQ